MWRPFAAETMTGEYEKNDKALQMILDHIKILCNHEIPVYEYFIKWIAQMIQYPEVKSIIITIISNQGAGKGTLMKLFIKMFGSEKVMETTEPSRDVWGQFNGMMVTSFLVNLNELSKKETMESEGKIKGLITDPTMITNNKGGNQFLAKSHHRFLVTTNTEDGGMKTTHDDRRNMMTRASDEKVGDKEYFRKLHEILDDEAVIRTCYDYFKSIPDMDKFGHLPMPVTEYQRELKKLTRCPVEMWLEQFTRDNMKLEAIEWTGKKTYEEFSAWATQTNIKYVTGSRKLGVKLTNMRLEGIQKGRHTNKGETKIFNIPLLKKKFNIGCLIEIDDETDEEN